MYLLVRRLEPARMEYPIRQDAKTEVDKGCLSLMNIGNTIRGPKSSSCAW